MHGLIFLQLQKFAQQSIGAEQWRTILAEAGLDKEIFSVARIYDDKQLLDLVALAAKSLNANIDDVVESFGRYIASELLRLYQRVVKPEWKTLDIIENTETFIHSAVRVANPGAAPPVLDAVRLSPNDLQLIYSSDRKLCRLAIGIIKGLADHFQETIEIRHDACMLKGAPFCSFHLTKQQDRDPTQQTSIDNTLELDISNYERKSSDLSSLAFDDGKTHWGDYLNPSLRPNDFGSLGPYRLIEKKGEGGMGVVFRALDTRSERIVAVKVLHPKRVGDETVRKRFAREIRALQSIKSPHVVEVYETGEVSRLPYLVMEFLKGSTLRAYRSRFRNLAIHEIIRIAIETTRGLAAVHDCGLVHRDLKPDNVWVESPSLNIKIIDFGLAHATTEDMRLTRTGMFIGTPSYMSPEQASGSPIDPKADLFSLGCMLYDLITDVRPFERLSVFGTLTALANHTPTPPHELHSAVPVELSKLTMQLLEKSPTKRPSNCREVEVRLATILEKVD
ncbi:MAG: heme NO-binding domain-containing protein [Planctomycetes bacterium]|nr:heme NO-binding domain-containing protein [Planctomycetota bacterium]